MSARGGGKDVCVSAVVFVFPGAKVVGTGVGGSAIVGSADGTGQSIAASASTSPEAYVSPFWSANSQLT